MKRTLLLLTAVALLAGPTAWAAKPDKPQPGAKPGAARMGNMPLVPPKALEGLKLTAEQKTKYDEIDAQWAKERDAWQASHMEENTKLRAEAKAAREAGDQAKAKELGGKMRELNAPMMELRKKYMDQVRALLTDEQKTTLDQQHAQMREHMRERGGKAKD